MTVDRDVLAVVSSWAGPAPKLEAEERPEILNDPWHTAVHEAGHAVVGRALGLDMGQASAACDGDSAGHSIVEDPWVTLARWHREGRYWREERSVLRARVLMLMAGAEAERAVLGGLQDVDGEHGDEGDRREVERIVSYYPDVVGDDPTRIRSLRRAVGRLVRRHRADVEGVAAALRDRGTLTGPELDEMVLGPKAVEPHPDWLALMEAEPEGEAVMLSALLPLRG